MLLLKNFISKIVLTNTENLFSLIVIVKHKLNMPCVLRNRTDQYKEQKKKIDDLTYHI